MADLERFRFDLARHREASELKPEHHADFMRLIKDLRYGGKFQLLAIEYNDAYYREELLRRLDAVLAETGERAAERLTLSAARFADFAAVEAAIAARSGDCRVLHLIDESEWFDAARWEAFNLRREAVAGYAPLCLMLWLSATAIRAMAHHAPDLWAWRGGVFDFAVAHAPQQRAAPVAQLDPVDARTLPQRSRRIAELRAYLQSDPPPPDDVRLPLWNELAELCFGMGLWDEALRIWREEELPVCERLDNIHWKAAILGQIVEVLQQRGQWGEALHILHEEVLPVCERLDDVRGQAITLSKIATILERRGQGDEALRILREKVLPVFEQLGDAYLRTVTMGNIAYILQQRGQWDEALHILREKVLLACEQLGDVRGWAVTLGKIADILQQRGQWDEALRIRREDELPVYERLGDVRELSVGRIKLAQLYLEKQPLQRTEAAVLLRAALRDARRLGMPEAQDIVAIMQKHAIGETEAAEHDAASVAPG